MAEGRPNGWPPADALDAGELLAAVRTGQVSVQDVVVGARLALLHDLDEVTAAIAAFEDDRALADARALDRTRAAGRPLGPLHGLPITVKDWIDVEGFPCAGEGGRAIGRRPSVDATVVARLRAAGAVVVAKTRSWDDGAPGGAVLHPLDATRTPGGSSSGEAVAVAAGASPAGHRQRLGRQHPATGGVVRRARLQADRGPGADDGALPPRRRARATAARRSARWPRISRPSSACCR